MFALGSPMSLASVLATIWFAACDQARVADRLSR
jgi:hypothetical protein